MKLMMWKFWWKNSAFRAIYDISINEKDPVSKFSNMHPCLLALGSRSLYWLWYDITLSLHCSCCSCTQGVNKINHFFQHVWPWQSLQAMQIGQLSISMVYSICFEGALVLKDLLFMTVNLNFKFFFNLK